MKLKDKNSIKYYVKKTKANKTITCDKTSCEFYHVTMWGKEVCKCRGDKKPIEEALNGSFSAGSWPIPDTQDNGICKKNKNYIWKIVVPKDFKGF